MTAPQKLKQELYNFCAEYVDARLVRIRIHISEIQEAMKSETKSSAGDKHETGRAMLQLEREKLGLQLSEAEKTKELLQHVNLNQKAKTVVLGSLVHTSLNSYYIAISSGEYKTGKNSIYCISAETPIGRLLVGKNSGDQVDFRNQAIIIKEVL